MLWSWWMKLMPPHWASATASSGDDTACMMALVRGTAMRMADSSPTRCRTIGALKATFSGTQSSVVRLGSSRYSFRVLDVSSAIRMPLLELLGVGAFGRCYQSAFGASACTLAPPRSGGGPVRLKARAGSVDGPGTEYDD